MGPALSAVVVLAINYAFATITRVSRERQQLIDELLATRDRLAETERAAGVAQERERLAHELHDTVAHHVSAIAVQAQAGTAVVHAQRLARADSGGRE